MSRRTKREAPDRPREDTAAGRNPGAGNGTSSASGRPLSVGAPRFRAGKRLWEQSEDAFLSARYPDEPTASLARELRRPVGSVYQRAQKLGLKKSAKYLDSPAACRLRRGDNVGAGTRFRKGEAPFNKGLKRGRGWAPGRMSETQFKPGMRTGIAARNWRPVGTILPDPEGYLRIKVREAQPGEPYGFGNPRVWPFLHRHLWEQANGPIPAGHALVFKNKNRQDVRLDNLEMLSRADLMRRNTVHNLPKPLAETIQLLGALRRQIRRKAKAHEEQNRRPA